MKSLKYLALAGLLSASFSANAKLYQFSYTFNSGDVSISGIFDGTANGDIINIDQFKSLSFTSPEISLTSPGKVNFGPLWPPVTAFTSFSGTEQNFGAGYSSLRGDVYFGVTAFAGRNASAQMIELHNYGWSTPNFYALDQPGNATWKVAAVVPEPATYGMLLAGLGAIGFLTRRKRPA